MKTGRFVKTSLRARLKGSSLDIKTTRERSALISGGGGMDNRLEMLYGDVVHGKGCRDRLHVRDLAGRLVLARAAG